MHIVHTYSIDTAHVAAHITRATHLTCLRATWPEDWRHPSEDGLAAVVARERPRPTSHPPSPDLEAVLEEVEAATENENYKPRTVAETECCCSFRYTSCCQIS